MAQQSTSGRRNGHSRQRSASARAKAGAKKPRRGGAEAKTKTKTKRAASTAARKTASRAARPGVAGGLARAAIKRMAKRAADASGEALRGAVERAGGVAERAGGAAERAGAQVAERVADRVTQVRESAPELTPATVVRRRLPIQRSIDIAVPIAVAWQEWIALDALPEGVHVVTEIERDGDELVSEDWSAEVIDEREEQSFAWQSHEGSDCAGLVTFHRLSDRLTRLELNLDVVPQRLSEAVLLSTHLADRQTERELRRLKARLELISPDEYEDPGESADPDRDETEQPDEDNDQER